MTRSHWLIALIVAIELGAILTHPVQSRAVLRTVYVFLWSVAPKIDGAEMPDRFAPK